VTVVVAVSDPPVDVQPTETPDTEFPDLSVTRAVISVLLPATTATESGPARTSVVAGPAVVVTCRTADDSPVIPPVNFDVRTVSLTVHVVVATPAEFVTLVVGLAVPPPVDTLHVTVTPDAG